MWTRASLPAVAELDGGKEGEDKADGLGTSESSGFLDPGLTCLLEDKTGDRVAPERLGLRKEELPGPGQAGATQHPLPPTVSMDSGSLVLSAIGDLPGGSSPSEDSCLLELQGSVRSVDYVLFRSIQRSRAGYCLSLDCGLRGPFEDSPLPRRPPRAARSYSCSAPEAPPTLGTPTAARSCHRLEGWPPWVGPCFPELRRRVPRGGSQPAAAPPTRAPTRRFSDSSGSLTPPPGHRPPHPAPPPPLLLPRSHSDPGITTSSATGEHPLPPQGSGEGRHWELEGQ